MAQTLWYLRVNGRVLGPFPSPQIAELLNSGEVTPEWEISLDETDWLTIVESGQFDDAILGSQKIADPETPGWREERQKARQRWLSDQGIVEQAANHDPSRDERTRQAISRDHVKTEALIEAEKQKPTSFISPLLGILVLLIVGIVVWWGQRERPIQTAISSVAACGVPASDGVNWSYCDKRGLNLTGLRARNARMEKVRLDNAQLGGADLAYTVLTGASLRNVQLSGSKLLGAELSGVDLSGADLAGANLQYAVLKGGVLAGTRLDAAQLDKATWVDGRICAEGSVGSCR